MGLKEIKNHRELRNLLSDTDWQKFEEVTGRIFQFNDYKVDISEVRTFKNTKRQYDVIAKNKDHLIVVDCKKWDKKRSKKSGLKKAIEKQIERTKKLRSKKEKYPLVVLNCSSPIKIHKEVPVIPIQKLNNFLLNFKVNKERILKV